MGQTLSKWKYEILRLLQQDQESAQEVHGFSTSHKIELKFIPERTPHFEGLWEAAVKNLKSHLRMQWYYTTFALS